MPLDKEMSDVAMDPVQLNALFMRIAVFLFGMTVYLYLIIVGLARWRGNPMRTPRFSQRWWSVVLFFADGRPVHLCPSATEHGAPHAARGEPEAAGS